MEPFNTDGQEPQVAEYDRPVVTDYGTLRELTEIAGTVTNSDVPHGPLDTAYPS